MYKGYYIDGVTFKSEKEIDEFRKENAIERYGFLIKDFVRKSDNVINKIIVEHEERLHNVFGLSYKEIEELEIKFMQTA